MYKHIIKNSYSRISYILILIIISLLCYIRILQPKNAEEITQETIPFNSLVYKCCTPSNATLKKNLFFLKTHKTGSTTVQNIVIRFAEKYSLSVMWPLYYSYYQPLSVQSLLPGTTTPDNKYNILAYHMRYTSKLKSYQYPGTLMITILRHPATLFQSIFNYFEMEKTTGMTIERFVKAPIKPSFLWHTESPFVYRGYNQMSVDLGFDTRHTDNLTAIRQFVEKIDEDFDFVMITEYMDASLILLANLMGWPLEYVVHLKLNARSPDTNRYVLTERDKLTLMELNQVDTFLYNHFLKKFRECVRQYGVEKMNAQILRLQKMNQEFQDRCVVAQNKHGFHGTVSYELRNHSDLECVSAVKDENHGGRR